MGFSFNLLSLKHAFQTKRKEKKMNLLFCVTLGLIMSNINVESSAVDVNKEFETVI